MQRILVLAALLAWCAACANALIIPARGQLPQHELLTQACLHVPDGWTVCYPYATNRYIVCGSGNVNKIRKCPAGTEYDYYLRVCLAKEFAQPCHIQGCPVVGSWRPSMNSSSNGVSALTTYFGDGPATYNKTMTQKGQTRWFCPSSAHCEHGMLVEVLCLGDPPKGRTPHVFHITWDELNSNVVTYPKQFPNIVGYIGDIITFDWELPLHNLVSFDPTAPDAANIVAYIPQPHVICPFFPFNFTGSGTGNLVQVDHIPGETRYVNETFMAFGQTDLNKPYTPGFLLTIDMSMDKKWIVDQHPSHCRMGMVFQLFVSPAPVGYVPQQYHLDWQLIDYYNWPDMNVTVGDILNFTTPPPAMFEGNFDFSQIQVYGMTMLEEHVVQRLYF